MVNRNKIFSFRIKRQAKNVFPNDVERTVVQNHSIPTFEFENVPHFYFIVRENQIHVLASIPRFRRSRQTEWTLI